MKLLGLLRYNGLAGPNLGTGELTMGSTGRAQVVGHTGSGSWDINRMASVEDAVLQAEGTEVRTDTSGVSVQSRGNLDSKMHETDSRQTCSRIGTGSQQLYRGFRAAPISDYFLPICASQEKPAKFDEPISFRYYFFQGFKQIRQGNKTMDLATCICGYVYCISLIIKTDHGIRNSSANSLNQTSDVCKVYYYVRNCSILFAGKTCVRI